MRPDEMLISDVFKASIDDDNTLRYEIPLYQREYMWNKNEWEMLFNDLVTNEKGYFLGSIIAINKREYNSDPAIMEIVDGQQRLTTISLLLLAIYSTLGEFDSDMDDILKRQYYDLADEISKKTRKGEFLIRLKLQEKNNNDYLALLYSLKLSNTRIDVRYASRRKIYRAYNFFKKTIKEWLAEDDTDNQLDKLLGLRDKVNSAIVIFIETKSNKDAYMLFESLNNRGVPLSALDLMKNLLVRESGDNARSSYEKWMDIVTNLTDDYSIQERFFRQYYNAFREELSAIFVTPNKRYLEYIATKSNLLSIYERLITKDYVGFLEKIKRTSDFYAIIINNSNDEVNEKLKESLLTLSRVQGVPSYILLLYLFYYSNNLNINDVNKIGIINTLIKFFIRRNLTDYPNTRKLTKIFMDIIDDVRNLTDNDVVTKINDYLRKVSAKDETFKQGLNGPIYQNNVDMTRFLLCYYEEQSQTKETKRDLWERDKSNKRYIWTIEHIFPEGDNIPQCWVDMIADGDLNKAIEYQNDYVDLLGNLTLSGYNSNLSNSSFEEKLNKTKDGKNIGYRNGLTLNQDVVDKTKWTIDDIKNRTDKLVDFFLEEFKF